MTGPAGPWSDPAAAAGPEAYTGPPATTAPPPYPAHGWAPPAVPYWAAGAPVPLRPRRPGQLVAAAVLAFVQAAVVTLTSAYLLLLANAFGLLSSGFSTSGPGGDGEAGALVAEAVVVTVVQLVSAVALVVGGVLVLNRRSRPSWLTLLAAVGSQLALSLYWLVRLTVLAGVPGEGIGPGAGLLVGVLLFTAAPAVALGLLLTGAARRWATGGEAGGSR